MKNEDPSGTPAGKSTQDDGRHDGGGYAKGLAQRTQYRAINNATAAKSVTTSIQPKRDPNSFAAYSDKPQPKSPKEYRQ